ncbi:glyoxalase superfamily protein [Winogradskyella immobilis]|uniref:Bleomycin resistance protein n=1 Tax=Winogradskyella immobilis TaxID=2816852 RepID=A0ABS8EMT9_9FLAO|nr:glyoxalase superfamily protein [Winogradskyella immobilis]MCC1484540.1 glyoxalase/bleomycin resistance/extradiol dioxygenase family protein [Winogradskyella immobilis]MCG0016632.1 glyoxalase/bleomycin resistance/extradiol dioxygenase family protein [Winogradskyella immobilis]
MEAYLKQVYPILPVKDVLETVDYYVNQLGFTLGFKDVGDHPNYAGVIRDGIEIHFQWHSDAEWANGLTTQMLRIYVDEIDILFEEYSTKNVFHNNTKLQNTSWGTKEFAFYDINTNGLTFYKDL